MSNLYKKIDELCTQKGIKGATLCKEAGISKGLLTDLKMGRRTGVSAVTAQKIADYFGVTVGYLLGQQGKKENSPSKPELTEGESMLLNLFRQIPADKQAAALEMLRAALKMQ